MSCYLPGRTNVLKYANTNTTSLMTRKTSLGSNDKDIVTIYNSALDTGKFVDLRTERGSGNGGAVIRIEGMVKARVAAWKNAKVARKPTDGRLERGGGESCEWYYSR